MNCRIINGVAYVQEAGQACVDCVGHRSELCQQLAVGGCDSKTVWKNTPASRAMNELIQFCLYRNINFLELIAECPTLERVAK